MKLIPLTRGLSAMVDDVDYDFLMQWKWRALKANLKKVECTYYAIRTTDRPNRKCVSMHREIMRISGVENFKLVDHRDSNGLNNQRSNLRPSTHCQNHWNRRKSSKCTSRFKGVYWHKKTSKWMARIYCMGKYYFLGTFEVEKKAAMAYDSAAKIHFGEFAQINIKSK